MRGQAASLRRAGRFPTGRHDPGIAHLLRAVTRGLVEAASPPIGVEAAHRAHRRRDDARHGRVGRPRRRGRRGSSSPAAAEIVERLQLAREPGPPHPQGGEPEVHKITDDDAKDVPSFAALADEIAVHARGVRPGGLQCCVRPGLPRTRGRPRDGDDGQLSPKALPQGTVDSVDPLVWARELQAGERSRRWVRSRRAWGFRSNFPIGRDYGEAALR